MTKIVIFVIKGLSHVELMWNLVSPHFSHFSWSFWKRKLFIRGRLIFKDDENGGGIFEDGCLAERIRVHKQLNLQNGCSLSVSSFVNCADYLTWFMANRPESLTRVTISNQYEDWKPLDQLSVRWEEEDERTWRNEKTTGRNLPKLFLEKYWSSSLSTIVLNFQLLLCLWYEYRTYVDHSVQMYVGRDNWNSFTLLSSAVLLNSFLKLLITNGKFVQNVCAHKSLSLQNMNVKC